MVYHFAFVPRGRLIAAPTVAYLKTGNELGGERGNEYCGHCLPASYPVDGETRSMKKLRQMPQRVLHYMLIGFTQLYGAFSH